MEQQSQLRTKCSRTEPAVSPRPAILRAAALVGVTAWLAAIGAGFGWLAAYESRPGVAGQPPGTWPDDSRLTRANQKWTAVMFLHPRCPCSQASLQEFAVLNSQAEGHLRAILVICKPEGVREGWEQTTTWKEASTLEHVERYVDEGDEERRRFGTLTSGQLVVYDPGGRLRYSGGITAARGKVGPSKGRLNVQTLLRGREPSCCEGVVYGCPLTEADSLSAR
jgi:hypothetical protein